jgi:hypothetical protein
MLGCASLNPTYLTSSLLSLIIVPVFYSLLEDLWRKLFKRH